MNRTFLTAAMGTMILGLGFACHADPAEPSPLQSDAPDSASASVLYNLGNSYARRGQPALAVLNYERARVLAPLDGDIRANLNRVRDQAGLTRPASPGSSFRLLSPNETYWLGVAGLFAAGLGWLFAGARRSYRVALRVVTAVGTLLMAFAIYDAFAVDRLTHEAVVMQTSAASASPVAGAEPLFTMPQATIVQRQDEHAGFTLVRDPRGRLGWVARDRLTPVIDSSRDLGPRA
jgi:hypothetical protein